MDPSLFSDPMGTKINDSDSEYHYDGLNCQNDKCKSYKLSADMEKEAAYIKKSRNN
jgi:hypothetical protein